MYSLPPNCSNSDSKCRHLISVLKHCLILLSLKEVNQVVWPSEQSDVSMGTAATHPLPLSGPLRSLLTPHPSVTSYSSKLLSNLKKLTHCKVVLPTVSTSLPKWCLFSQHKGPFSAELSLHTDLHTNPHTSASTFLTN